MELTGDERAELLRLRAELARLRATGADPRPGHPPGVSGRWTAATVLLLLSAVVGVAAVVGGFVRAEVLDTNQYVATVAPLAQEPSVQQAVADRVSDELVTRLDLAGLTQQLVDALEERGAPELLDGLVAPITSGIRSFIDREVRAILATEQFAQVWEMANRVAHDELDALLTTGHGDLLSLDGDTVMLDLGEVFNLIKQRLVDAGFTLVQNVPDISVTLPLVTSEQIPKIRDAVRLLDAAARILPPLALGLLVAGVVTAPGRRRGLLIGAATFGVGMLLLLAALRAGRAYYLDHLSEATTHPDAAAAIYDTVLRFLVTSAQSLAVLAALIVLACWLAGPSRAAVAIRRAGGWVLDRAAAGVDRLGLPTGRVDGFIRSGRKPIEVLLVVLAAGILLWQRPGIAGTLWLAAGLLAALGVVELIARMRSPAPAGSPAQSPAQSPT